MINTNTNYDPIEDFLNSVPENFSQRGGGISQNPDSSEIADEHLRFGFEEISLDLNNISQKNDENLVFFPQDVSQYDLFNVHSPADLATHTYSNESAKMLLKENNFEINEDNLENLENELKDIDLYIIDKEGIEKLKKIKELEKLKKPIEEVDINFKKADFKRNPEEIIWAIKNKALAVFKKIGEENKKEDIEIQVDAEWAGPIKKYARINVYDEKGELKRQLNRGEFRISEMTAAETEFVTKLAFRAIQLSFYLRILEEKREEQKKAEEEKKRAETDLLRQQIINNNNKIKEKRGERLDDIRKIEVKINFSNKFDKIFLILKKLSDLYAQMEKKEKDVQEQKAEVRKTDLRLLKLKKSIKSSLLEEEINQADILISEISKKALNKLITKISSHISLKGVNQTSNII